MRLSAQRPTRCAAQRAERDAEAHGEDEGRTRQQQGRRQPFQDQRGDRDLLPVREAEVEGEHALHVDPQLHQQRPVQAELLPKLLDEPLIRRTRLPGDDGRRITRRGVDQEEVADDDGEHDHHRLHAPPQQEARQVRCLHQAVRNTSS
jgi:hypothetical protein